MGRLVIFNCFSASLGRKKKDKQIQDVVSPVKKYDDGSRTLQVKLEHPIKSSSANGELNSTSFSVTVPYDVPENSNCKVKVTKHESPTEREPIEVAYEGEDEWDDKSPMKRNISDDDIRACEFSTEEFRFEDGKMNTFDSDGDADVNQNGHMSDPGMGRVEEHRFSPRLKRTCSNLESRQGLKNIADQLPPSRSQSFEQLHELSATNSGDDFYPGSPCSHTSNVTHYSADKVILKKRSSSQILPSRSKRLWWQLFLWSHRNLQRPLNSKKLHFPLSASFNQQGGYSSDTLEPSRTEKLIISPTASSPLSISEKNSDDIGHNFSSSNNNDSQNLDKFKERVSGLWPQNQWVAFSMEASSSSSLRRVDEWVKDLDIQSPMPAYGIDNSDEAIEFPPSPDRNNSTTHLIQHPKMLEELLQANSLVQSLNSSSTVAHISGLGLKVIPTISQFSRLRSVNLSNNSISHIATGSLPKGLHVLDLSRNKISIIEGLRELTRLRVLDLSYNKISRIGQGLSCCALLKELYLSGNKISDVEGLHRLLKLTVLDLSFNKITTTKSLGQLVANYNSLVAVNLLGNPIQNNLSEDQLRKTVSGLLPKLAYLSKQPINQQKARELGTDMLVKASLANRSHMNRRKKSVKKVSPGGGFSSTSSRSGASVGQRSRLANRMKSGSNHRFPSRLRSSSLASTSQEVGIK